MTTSKYVTEDNRINRVEDQLIDMRLAVSVLLETVTRHQLNFETTQGNFETVVTEIRDIRTDMLQMQSEVIPYLYEDT